MSSRLSPTSTSTSQLRRRNSASVPDRPSCESEGPLFWPRDNLGPSQDFCMENYYYSQLNSPIGSLNIAVSERGLMLLDFDGGHFPPRNRKFGDASWHESASKTQATVRQLS